MREFELESITDDMAIIYCRVCYKKTSLAPSISVIRRSDLHGNHVPGGQCRECSRRHYYPFTPAEWVEFKNNAFEINDNHYVARDALIPSQLCRTFTRGACIGSIIIKARQLKLASRKITQEERNLCVVCFETDKPMDPMPCKHYVCADCHAQLRSIDNEEMSNRCPYCKTFIKYTHLRQITKHERRI
ncbi:Oidioi.mRNA.OKI2018_I69.PAR.g13073.t1.cds [Oikopleura dioica]|uniref:Oidioi.mRNA.OKI2018_I69.PAR.g13073.t1.cds n=1 Tax=Oikopleura dioica TaxID=34765 RepID=A0ABN7S685_OIKDI|nr:Oidioi.mRNA.OKI2018_I69.PAR.g13073.t1.cds [Oikopleura dioica]